MYNNVSRTVKANEVVDARNLIYYSNIKAEETKSMADDVMPLRSYLPEGWNGVIVADNDHNYVLISNFKGATNTATISGLKYMGWAPVFKEETTINDTSASITFKAEQNNSIAEPITAMIKGNNIKAQMENDSSLYITASSAETIEISIIAKGNNSPIKKELIIKNNETIRVYLDNGEIKTEETTIPVIEQTDYTGYIINPKFEGNSTYGWTGSPTANYNCAEKFNTTFDVNQTVKGLPEGYYSLSMNGFYRAGGYAIAGTSRTAGTEKLNAQLYANDSIIAVKSIFEEVNKKGATGVKVTNYGYIPDNMEQASVYFGSLLYPNTLICHVGEDGILKLGVKKTTTITNDWCIFTNFTLTYLGTENPFGSTGIEEIKRNSIPVKEGIYNLQGIKLNSLPKEHGIYVVNGVKCRF